MLQHEREGLRAGLLAQLRQQRDVSADERLQFRPQGAEHRSRSHRDSADDAEVVHDPQVRKLHGRRRRPNVHWPASHFWLMGVDCCATTCHRPSRFTSTVMTRRRLLMSCPLRCAPTVERYITTAVVPYT